jgi:hypothetical protein
MRPYIDCHNHIGRTIDRVPPTGQNTAMCLSRFAQTQIHAAISMPTAVGSPIARGIVDIRDQNEVIGRACRDFSGVFPIGLALMEARFGQLGVEEVERAMSEYGLVGVVGHPPIGPWCIPFVEAAAARGGLCNLHQHNPFMAEVAAMFPNATFISHASTWAAENLVKYDNIFFEVVQDPDGPGSEWDFQFFADKVGRERLIFGADLPYYDYRVLQKKIEEAPIDDDLKDRIAYKNLEALIQRFKPDWRMPEAPPVAPRVYRDEELWAVDPKNPVRLTVLA